MRPPAERLAALASANPVGNKIMSREEAEREIANRIAGMNGREDGIQNRLTVFLASAVAAGIYELGLAIVIPSKE